MDLWDQALKGLDSSDRKHFPSNVQSSHEAIQQLLKDVQGRRDLAREKRWKYTKSDGSVIILRDVFEKIFDSISRYGKVIDVAVSVDPLHAAPAWAIVRFLLQVSTSDIGAFGCLSEGIETVAGVIGRYELLKRLYLPAEASASSADDLLLRGCIVKVYSSTLKYLANAKRFWSTGTAKRMAKGVFTNLAQSHDDLQSSIKTADEESFRVVELLQSQQRAEESKATRNLLHGLQDELSMPIIRMARSLSKISDRLDREQRRDTLQWLSSVPCELQHREAAKKIVKGTGQWLVTSQEYTQWQNSSQSSIFWLHGIPGAGKSKLTSIVIESYLGQHGDRPLERPPLAYFYCSKKGADSRSRDPLEIASALLRQLTGSDPSSALRGTVAFEFEQRRARLDDPPRLNLEEVIDFILKVVADDPITLVIDALDEIDEDTRGELFDSLERVVREAHNVVKIFVSSRNDGDIVDRFESCPNICIKESMSASDIQEFTKCKVQEAVQHKKILRGRVSPALRHDIVETLTAKAQGMFRWVELSIETLSSSRRIAVERDVRSQLGRMPAKLHEQYQLIYNEILDANPSTASIARRVFCWILAAARALTVEEMLAAVALDDDGFFHEDLNADGILDICRNFLMVTTSEDDDIHTVSKVFQMAHLSVREFLDQLPEFSSVRIHTQLVSRLLHAVNPDPSSNGHLGHQSIRSLQSYSVRLFEHAERSSLCDAQCHLAQKMKSFMFNGEYRPTENFLLWARAFDVAVKQANRGHYKDDHFLDNHHHDDRSPYMGASFLLCRYGLLSVLQLLGRNTRIQWNDPPFRHTNRGLVEATWNGKYAVAEWLLQRQLFHPDECDNPCSALFIAAHNMDYKFVSLLLRYGADPLKHSLRTPWIMLLSRLPDESSLRSEAFETFKEMFHRIQEIETEAFDLARNIGFDWKFQGLFASFHSNWAEASDFLISRGANDRMRISHNAHCWYPEDEKGPSSLQVAVRYTEFKTIETLLSHSRGNQLIVPEASDKPPMTDSPEHRLYTNHLDDRGRSAFHYLMSKDNRELKENEKIMKLLLRHGTDPLVESFDKVTALHVAAAIGSTPIIQHLISIGLQPTAVSSSGATTLHFACQGIYSSPDVVHFLTDRGLDPIRKDMDGNTPLHFAAASCNTVALAELLGVLLRAELSRPVEATNKIETQLLPQEAPYATFPPRKLALLVNLRNCVGETPLHVIAKHRYCYSRDLKVGLYEADSTKTVDLLVDHGFDINALSGVGETPLMSMMKSRMRPHLTLPTIKYLLSKGAYVQISDSEGKTPLHYAAGHHSLQCSKLLLRSGADLEARDHDLNTPLHLAARRDVETVLLLLDHGADIESQNVDGRRPMHHAVWAGNRCIAWLARRGADLNCRDISGSTPLHLAIHKSSAPSADTLLDLGANPEIMNGQGKTPLHCVAEYEDFIDLEVDQRDRPIDSLWLTLFHASEEWCKTHGTRPHTLLKRVSSQIIRKNRCWDDFSELKSDILSKM